MQRSGDMHFELRRGVTHGGQRGDGGDFPAAQVQPRARINIAKRELKQIAGEVRCDILQAIHDGLTTFSINLLQHFLTGYIAF